VSFLLDKTQKIVIFADSITITYGPNARRKAIDFLNTIQKILKSIFHILFLGMLSFFISENSFAAYSTGCSGTDYTWVGTADVVWKTPPSNWSPAVVPNASTANVIIDAGKNTINIEPTGAPGYLVGCVDILSGGITDASGGGYLTVYGSHFYAPYANLITFTKGSTLELNGGTTGGGTLAQTFETISTIQTLKLTNKNSVTLKNNFRISTALTLAGSGTVYVTGNLYLTAALTIPTGYTVIIQNGGAIYSDAGVTVSSGGKLQIDGGAELRIAAGKTLNINSGGVLKAVGSSGNPAHIMSYNTSSQFTFTMSGDLYASQLIISRATNATTGVNFGTAAYIYQLDNTQFRGMKASSYGFTLANTTTVIPTAFDNLGFYNDDAVATSPISTSPKNINASAYAAANAISMTNYSGDLAGSTYVKDNTPSKITWSTTAPTELQIINTAETNKPTATMTASTTGTFAEFAFLLNQADVATNITQVIVTMTGTASMADIANVKAYRDTNANCNYDVGTDTQIGSDLVFSGSPPKATITIPSGNIQTSSTSTTAACLHIVATTGATPANNKTISFGIVSTADVTNSQNYTMSGNSGTPVYGAATTLSGTADNMWRGVAGAGGTNFSTNGNWTTGAAPVSTTNCQIGLAMYTTLVDVAPPASVACNNATLQSGGTLDFGGATRTFNVSGALDVGASYTFTSATLGIIAMVGTTNQTLALNTTFPGSIDIINTGTTGNNQIDVMVNSTITGNLNCKQGILNIPNGVTLTVVGSVNIGAALGGASCTIVISPGGTLALGAVGTASVVTVNATGTLQMVGTSALKAIMKSAGDFSVNVLGTIKAQYYVFDHLSLAGVSIASGATIDTTYHLQDGTFVYPVDANTILLTLNQQVPGDSLANMNFQLNGSAATGVTNIKTNMASVTPLGQKLSLTNYSGDLSESTHENGNATVYQLLWGTAINSMTYSQNASFQTVNSGVTAVTAGQTYNMGRFSFKQDTIGSFVNTNVTSLKLSLYGTGSSTDVAAVRLYSNSSCSGSGGTLIGTGTFTGNPASVTFSIASGSLVIPNTTSIVCAYVEFDIATNATNGNTLGVKIVNGTDLVNSAGYIVSGATTFPLTLGTAVPVTVPTTYAWNGAGTAWEVGTNWTPNAPTGGPPTGSNCTISSKPNAPTIALGVTAICKSLTITNGNLTVATGGILNVSGDFANTGTFTNNGTFNIIDSGSNSHYISSSSTIGSVNLSAVGSVFVNSSSLTMTTLGTMSSTTTLTIPSGKKLILSNGYTLSTGTMRVEAGGTLEIVSGKTLTVAGGTFQVAGTNDVLPQLQSTKGIVQVSGGAGSFTFTATSGTVDLLGFQFDRLDNAGLNIGGTTTIANLSGGQFTNLSTSYALMKAIQITTSGSIPASANNIGWSWGAFNAFTTATANTPTSSAGYTLVYCSGAHNIDFIGYDGDWFSTQLAFTITNKVSAVSGCTVTMSGAAASAVSLLSFTATPYNAAVDIQWETNVERDHLGFNIYRTTDAADRFVQINKKLIRNIKTSTSNRGAYRFVDIDVANNQNYYYYLEDVDIHGKTTMHGPVFAAPLAFLGTPPLDQISQNSATNSVVGTIQTTRPSIYNPTFQDLGNGIVILSQTSKSLRIRITPPTPVFSASAWNNSYEEITMAGYSKLAIVGEPELPVKDVLIEVHQFATTATNRHEKVSASLLTNHLVAPAPNYVLNNSNTLTTSYSINSAVYSTNEFLPLQRLPSEFIEFDSKLILINDKKYLKLKVNPMRYNAFAKEIKSANQITVDIGLNGDDWNIISPNISSNVGPYAVANTLRIDYAQEGFQQITYDDFVNSQVEGPFNLSDTSLWRLYYKDSEIPLEIHSATGLFSAGDYIRFYAPFTSSLESKTNQLILSPVDLTGSSVNPMRIGFVDANPIGQVTSNQVLMTFKQTHDQNTIYVNGFTLDDNLDHYFDANLVSDVGYNVFSLSMSMPELDVNNPDYVELKYYVRGELGIFQTPIRHHVTFSIAGIQYGEAIFDENTRSVLTFQVPYNVLVAGTNTFDLHLPGTFAGADFDRLLIDRVEITYRGYHASSSGISTFIIPDQSRAYTIDNLLSNIVSAYDITDPWLPKKLVNMQLTTPNGGITYAVKYFVDNNVDQNYLKAYSFIEGDKFNKPLALSLNTGSQTSLRNSTNEADLIIIGDENLIVAAQDLVAMRIAQGLIVKTVTPEEIYAEFSYGQNSSKAIRDFISTAIKNWSKTPHYVLILGDGTNDPLDHNVGVANNLFVLIPLVNGTRSAEEHATFPAPMINGRFIDFSSDNYFVSTDMSHLPQIAIGRIPTNDASKIKAYIEKVKKYESGDAAPTATVKKISFFADQDTSGDFQNFSLLAQNMMSYANGFTNTLYDRTVLGSLQTTRDKISSEFNAGPLMISMNGHGASNMFGDKIYTTTEAANLTNNIYPLVTVWNCETAYFYDADKNMKTLGEELIYNPHGGAIAFLGSTTETTPSAQAHLAQNFFSQLTSVTQKTWDGGRLGDILLQAKIATGPGAYEKDIVNSFSIIGDPSLKLPSNLYKANPYAEAAAPPKAKGIFGCSAGAADGTDATPWHEGLIEWLIYMALIVFGVRRITRNHALS
jgi:hypothetical protein